MRSLPIALGGVRDGSGASRRPVVIGAAALGGLILLVLVTLMLSGGGGADGDPLTAGAAESPAAAAGGDADASPAPARTPEPTPQPTAEPGGTMDPEGSPPPDDGTATALQDISYEVQEGEALKKIAEGFGTTRRKILNANEGMAEKSPYVVAGDVIIVPASADMTIEELEAFAGYLGPAE